MPRSSGLTKAEALETLRMLGPLDGPLWLAGGIAADFHVGRWTREHDDIDLVTFEEHREGLADELARDRVREDRRRRLDHALDTCRTRRRRGVYRVHGARGCDHRQPRHPARGNARRTDQHGRLPRRRGQPRPRPLRRGGRCSVPRRLGAGRVGLHEELRNDAPGGRARRNGQTQRRPARIGTRTATSSSASPTSSVDAMPLENVDA